MKQAYLIIFCLVGLAVIFSNNELYAQSSYKKSIHNDTSSYQVAVYYFPNYHTDKRNDKYFGKGWTEWELLKAARPRFEGHQQPKIPMWGYEDESDPKVMNKKILAASANGINAFIFDWYYYNDGPFLQSALEDGFMKAKNRASLKFAIMWANHDYTDVFPSTLGVKRKLMFAGKISSDTWNKMTDYIIAKYFKNPSYWLIDDAPYFSIYDFNMFVRSFGNLNAAEKALLDFRNKTKAAGFKDLHLNGIVTGGVLADGSIINNQANQMQQLGFNSFTSYVWYHHGAANRFPITNYDSAKSIYLRYEEAADNYFTIPYYPNVTMGWDPSPRTNQQKPLQSGGYPFTPIIIKNTPQAFKKALIDVKSYNDNHVKGRKIITINAWNEWTEGSYLEPDNKNKMGYLNAIKEVFGLHK